MLKVFWPHDFIPCPEPAVSKSVSMVSKASVPSANGIWQWPPGGKWCSSMVRAGGEILLLAFLYIIEKVLRIIPSADMMLGIDGQASRLPLLQKNTTSEEVHGLKRDSGTFS